MNEVQVISSQSNRLVHQIIQVFEFGTPDFHLHVEHNIKRIFLSKKKTRRETRISVASGNQKEIAAAGIGCGACAKQLHTNKTRIYSRQKRKANKQTELSWLLSGIQVPPQFVHCAY